MYQSYTVCSHNNIIIYTFMNSIDAAYYSLQGQHWVKCIPKTVYVTVHPAVLMQYTTGSTRVNWN